MFWLLLAGCLHRDLAPNVAMTLARIAVDEQRGWGHEPEAAFSLDHYADGRYTFRGTSSATGEQVLVVVEEGRVSLYDQTGSLTAR